MSNENSLAVPGPHADPKGDLQNRAERFCNDVDVFCDSMGKIPSKSQRISERSHQFAILKSRARSAVGPGELDQLQTELAEVSADIHDHDDRICELTRAECRQVVPNAVDSVDVVIPVGKHLLPAIASNVHWNSNRYTIAMSSVGIGWTSGSRRADSVRLITSLSAEEASTYQRTKKIFECVKKYQQGIFKKKTPPVLELLRDAAQRVGLFSGSFKGSLQEAYGAQYKEASFEKMCDEILVENYGKVGQWESGTHDRIQAALFEYIDTHPLAEDIPEDEIREMFVVAIQKEIAGKIERLEKELTFTKAKQRWGMPVVPSGKGESAPGAA
jgi:hypothetical protein